MRGARSGSLILVAVVFALAFRASTSYARVPSSLHQRSARDINFVGTGGTPRTPPNNLPDPRAATDPSSDPLVGIPADPIVTDIHVKPR